MKYRSALLFIGLCCLCMISACNEILGYSSGKELRGVILDAVSGEPIPGAIVVANWITSVGTMGGSEGVCFHAGSAITNAAGEYYMPPWRQKSPFSARFDRDVMIFAHKPGYQWPNCEIASIKNNIFLLAKGADTAQFRCLQTTNKLIHSQQAINERLQYLREVARQTYCNRADESINSLLSLRRALLEEALAIAPAINDPVIEYLLESVEQIELGYEEADRRHFERTAEENKEHRTRIIEPDPSIGVKSIDHSLPGTRQ